MKTNTVWKTGHQFESTDEENKVQIDAERESGINPKAMLLSALASCSGVDVVDILTKMRVDFSGMEIEVEADQTDGQPKVFKDFHMRFRINTADENRDKVIRAIELSLEKYCGVAAMLRKNSEIHYTLELMEHG
jgi:putative redox protein